MGGGVVCGERCVVVCDERLVWCVVDNIVPPYSYKLLHIYGNSSIAAGKVLMIENNN